MPFSRNGLALGGLVLGVLASGCNPESLIKLERDPPTVVIKSPNDGETFVTGQEIVFEAVVGSSQTELTSISHEWVSGSEQLCESAAVEPSGIAQCHATFNQPGDVKVTINVRNSDSDTAKDEVDIVLVNNEPPTLEIVAPLDGAIVPSNQLVVLEANVSDPEDAPDQLRVEVKSNTQGDLVTSNAEGAGNWEDSATLATGVHQLEFCVYDTFEKKDCDKIVVTVNTAPTAPVVDIQPDPAQSGLQLEAKITTQPTDPDPGDTLVKYYAWKLNGVEYPNPTYPSSNAFIDPGVTVRGDYLEVEVWAEDGVNVGPKGIDNITIGNSPPSIQDCAVSPSNPKSTDDLFAASSGWFDQDLDPPGIQYKWEKWDVTGWVGTGQNGDILSNDFTVRGERYRVECVPSDGLATGDSRWSTPVTVSNSPPTLAACPIFPSNPDTTDDLTATPQGANDSDNDAITFTYKWFRDGVEIPGETTATLPASYTQRDDLYRVECTPHDLAVAGTPVYSPPQAILNSPPTQPVPILTPAAPVSGQSIVASLAAVSTDADGDNVSYNIYWYKDGQAFDNPTFPTTNVTLPAGQTNRFEYWKVEVEPYDGITTGPIGVIDVTIANAPPTISTCLINPTNPGVADDLTANPIGFNDQEGDSAFYSYLWYKDTGGGFVATNVTGPTYPSANTALGDRIMVECTPSDGFEDGPTVQANPVQLGNTPPTITGCNIFPVDPDTYDDLSATPAGWFDVDGDSPGYRYAWYVDGALDPNVTTATYPYGETEKGEEFTVECTPDDGSLTGTPVVSGAVTVLNSPPSAPVVELTPANPQSNEALTVNVITDSVDPDGDTVVYNFYWEVDSAQFPNPTYPSSNNTINAPDTARDQFWQIRVVPNDGTVDGAAGVDTVTIGNTPPVMQGCNITPSVPNTNDPLTANPSGWLDNDNDTEGYQYRWYVLNGGNWQDTGVTSATYAATSTTRGQTYKVDCTPYDGITTGNTVSAAPVNVVNSLPSIDTCTLTPGTANTTHNIAAGTTGWADQDGDAPGYVFAWFKNNALDVNETGASYPSTKTLRDDTLRVECTPNDGIDLGGTLTSTTLTIMNAPPTAPLIAISPGTPKSGSAFTANVVIPSVDPDNDPITYRYYWRRDGVAYSNPTFPSANNTIGANIAARDEFWDVEVTAYDTSVESTPGADSVLVVNSEPSLTSVSIVPQNPETADDIVATAIGWRDYDNDPETYNITWYKNDLPDATEVTDTFPSSKTQRGDRLRVEFEPVDPYVTGTTIGSGTVTVVNSKPTPPVLSISPFPPITTSTLQCNMDVPSTDDDNDSVTYTYNWYSTTGQGPIPGSTLPSSYTSIGEGWWCEAVPNDTLEDGTTGVSPTTFIQDLNAPDPPIIDPIDPVRNEDTVTLTGTCEANCTVTLHCSDTAPSTWQEVTSCSGVSDFSHTVSLARGVVSSCYATCTDGSSNVSGNSNTVTTESCASPDVYEGGGLGNDPTTAIAQWSDLPDDNSGGVITIGGNILPGDPGDWYRITTTDNVTDDIANGVDNYNFTVTLTTGDPLYSFLVHRGGFEPDDMECPAEWSVGYTDYSDFVDDPGNADHAAPSPGNLCGSGANDRNDCNDLSTTYWIQVMRTASTPSCDAYSIDIQNGP